VWKLPSLLELLSNGGPVFSCSWTLDHLSSTLSSWPWSTQTTSFPGLMSAMMVPATMPVSIMGQN
jgi:hypothetical protein